MDYYGLGQIVGSMLPVILFAGFLIVMTVNIIRYNIIRERDGKEAAREFWNRGRNRTKNKRRA